MTDVKPSDNHYVLKAVSLAENHGEHKLEEVVMSLQSGSRNSIHSSWGKALIIPTVQKLTLLLASLSGFTLSPSQVLDLGVK